ncbi:hypothetical protein [Ruminococcus albus]|uniref:SpoIIAA-like n=1 Tax=Ruminococcus albus TaxID=1264 RepID=A0A1I1D1I3_RUMAL|nr:hypothetical protein [Ruminococcus albus]SFB66670.1 hypothetical protein SAMN02910406_00110 [Ruminococcus albus]
MDDIQQAAIKKKSFELNYNGGTIWCEHLDGMGGYEDEVIEKLLGDKKAFSRPSSSAFMIINLDKTEITERITETIFSAFENSGKVFRKIAFVGVGSRLRREIKALKAKCIAVETFDDYEKAKDWLLP